MQRLSGFFHKVLFLWKFWMFLYIYEKSNHNFMYLKLARILSCCLENGILTRSCFTEQIHTEFFLASFKGCCTLLALWFTKKALFLLLFQKISHPFLSLIKKISLYSCFCLKKFICKVKTFSLLSWKESFEFKILKIAFKKMPKIQKNFRI